ncbi:MAG: 1-acyl-sn-glycerol-3-phosphate acyltransferase [bacterium]
MTDTVLSRLSYSSLGQESQLTSTQSQVDAMVSGFAEQASDWRSLAAMATGSLFYRVGRMGTLALGARAGQVAAPVINVASYGIGLGTEVAAFEGTSRLLATATGDRSNANLWNWSGRGGWRDGLASSMVTFGMLKGAGSLGQSQNVLIQHLFSDLAMVGGHQVTGALGWTPHAEGTFAEQMLHAEVTNIQLGAGMSLLHTVAPGLAAFERGLDLSLRARELPSSTESHPETGSILDGMGLALETAGGPSLDRASSVRAPEELVLPTKMAMSMTTVEGETTPIPSSGRSSSHPSLNPNGNGNGEYKTQRNLPERLRSKASERFTSHVEEPAPPIRSTEDAVHRAEALGQSELALRFLRWGAHQMRDTPEARQRLFDLMQRVFEFQRRQRERLDPILKDLPTSDYQELNRLAGEYRRAINDLTPLKSAPLGEALLLIEATRSLETLEDYAKVTDEDLRSWGLEPDALYSMVRNAHAMQGHVLRRILNHPLLRDRPENQALLDAHALYLRQEAESLSPLPEKMSNESKDDIIETRKRGITEATQQFQTTMRDFLFANATQGRVFFLEMAKISSLTRALYMTNRHAVMNGISREQASLPAESQRMASTLLENSDNLNAILDRGAPTRFFFGALSLVGLDPDPLHHAEKRYEESLDRWIQNLPIEHMERLVSNLAHAPSEAELARAQTAQREFNQAQFRVTQEVRSRLDALRETNDGFWQQADREQNLLFVEDIRVQLDHVTEQMARVRSKIGANAYERNYGRQNSDYQTKLSEAQAILSSLEQLTAPDAPPLNSLDMNRNFERALQAVSNLRKASRKALGRSRLGGADYLAVSPLGAVVAMKFDQGKLDALGGSISAAWPHLLNTVPEARRVINSEKGDESITQRRRIFGRWTDSITDATDSSYVVDPHIENLISLSALNIASKHNSWLDFFEGGLSGVRSAHLNGEYTAHDVPAILAKDDLGQKMMETGVGRILSRVIRLLSIAVGRTPPQYELAVTQGARAMAFRDRTTACFPELTMPVGNFFSPIAFDPMPHSTSIMAPVNGGRNYSLVDRAMALSGRPYFTMVSTSLNVNRLYPPKPNRPFPLRSGASVTVAELYPTSSLVDAPQTLVDSKQPITSQSNMLRTFWLRMTMTPENAVSHPSIERMFAPFAKPLDASTESTLESMFGGALGVYPSIERVERTQARVGQLETQLASATDASRRETEYQLQMARQALVNNEIQFFQTPKGREHLRVTLEPTARQIAASEEALRLASASGANRGERRALEKVVENHRRILRNVEAKLRDSRPLTAQELREWQALQQNLSGRVSLAEAGPILENLSGLISQVSSSSHPDRRRILSLLKQRRAQVSLAQARAEAGERLTPVEEVLMADLRGSTLRRGEEGPQDALVSALQNGLDRLSPEQTRQLLSEETIREVSRRYIRNLPGSGRGTIDSVAESVERQRTVRQDSLGRFLEGPKSALRTLDFGLRFVAGCGAMVLASIPDLLTGNYFQTYNKVSAATSRWVMGASKWHHSLSAEDVRVLEDVRIRSQRERRPIAIATNHLSWTDITTIMSVFPETRFGAKLELLLVLPLGAVLLAGRHTMLPRPSKNASPAARARAFAQVRGAGEKMLKYGVSTLFFLPGTRSKTGTIGRPKTGAANLALGTDALLLTGSLLGTNEVMGLSWGKLFTRGTGMDRRVFSRFRVIDSNDHRTVTEGEPSLEDVRTLTNQAHQAIEDLFFNEADELRRLAQSGDRMAQSQLSTLVSNLQPGMDLILNGQLERAQRWAEGTGGKNQGMKTSYDFLLRFTEWWTGRPARRASGA